MNRNVASPSIQAACSRAAAAGAPSSAVIGTTAFIGDLRTIFEQIETAMLLLAGERMIASADGMRAQLNEIDRLLERAHSKIVCINSMLSARHSKTPQRGGEQ